MTTGALGEPVVPQTSDGVFGQHTIHCIVQLSSPMPILLLTGHQVHSQGSTNGIEITPPTTPA